ncbi:MAG: hypothetical protein IMF14_07130 [Proteobacteria bacterium]|nr:hypothetical protein [Pseudomonadota bacterium]
MSISEIYLIVPNHALSALIWFFIISSVLYFARVPAIKYIIAFSEVLHNALRLAANSVNSADSRLQTRNREVLLEAGREATERMIEREFERVEDSVTNDLAQYPALQRKLSERITSIDEDYKQSTEVPPNPPQWSKVVESVAKIDSNGDAMVAQILKDIHKSMIKAQDVAIKEHRRACMQRHSVLKRMMPHWRSVKHVLGEVDRNISSIIERAGKIGRYMDDYEAIIKGSDRALRVLSSSSISQFFISAFVLSIAIGGAAVNFTLIARPMAEMVGGSNFIGSFKVSEVSAIVIILVEVSMGLFLMESLRITRLFPVIGALNDKLRVRMIWITFGFLLVLASVEAGLAFMREILMEDELATSAMLRGDGVVAAADFAWITTAAQMGMGFILPFALVFVAIPLETFVSSTRTVVGIMASALLRALAFVLRLTGNIARYSGKTVANLYDLIIFGPLWLERTITKKWLSDGAETNSPAHATTTDFQEAV